MSALSPAVAHYRAEFPVYSETFVRLTATTHRRYRATVLTHRVGTGMDPACATYPLPLHRLDSALAGIESLRLRVRAAALSSALQHLAPDVLHAHFGEDGVIAARALRGGRTPLVATFYGFDASELGRLPRWRRRFRLLFAAAAAVLAEGPHLAARLRELGAPAAKVRLQRIPLRLELFPFQPPALPQPGEPLVVLQAARFVEKKGVDTTIRAFAAVAAAEPTAVLWLLGSGPEESRLRALAASTGAADRIRFIPAQSHEEYARVLRQAHVFVHPSRTAANGDEEGGAPTALLEAQATGLPTVATRHADIPFIVSEPAALLVEPDDHAGVAAALVDLLRAPQEWHARAEAGRRHVEREHDPTRLQQQLEALYDEVRGAPGSAAAMTSQQREAREPAGALAQ